MNISDAIKNLSNKILEDINNSGLHPSISKLILLDIIHNIEKYEESEKENIEDK